MKFLFALFVLGSPFAAFSDHQEPVCSVSDIRQDAREVAQAAYQFVQLIQNIPLYDSLGQDTSRVVKEAKELSGKATHGTPCHYLKRDFEFVERAFGTLRAKHRQLQTVRPNLEVRDAMHKLTMFQRHLERAINATAHPLPVAQTLTCGSHNHGYTECAVGGPVLKGTLVQQLSHAHCLLGKTFGFHSNAVWVTEGCRGNFQVTYLP